MDRSNKKWLLCDLHIHTDISDGRLSLPKVIDLYGEKGFDVISITDHLYEQYTINLWLDNNERPCTVPKDGFEDYLALIRTEAQRAWEKYEMLVIPGVEISNNYGKFHILAIDVKEYIDPDQTVEKIIKQIHDQGAVAIAGHPHHKDSEGEMPFIHLWNNHEKYARLFDAWEVANRDDLFNVVGLKKFNYIAGSDFHEKRHLYSWKSLIKAEKNIEAVKEAIRVNKNIAIYLFRKEKPIDMD
ncbi:MAG: phosphotransferase [Candidatus Omnitrophica bacterium]|nr:phosphotransferase [Candidatus Omnitrophota bacterium]